MDQEIKSKLIAELIKQPFTCLRHPQQISNLIMIDEESTHRGLLCSVCLGDILVLEPKSQEDVRPLKYLMMQIHRSYTTLVTSLPTCAFVDHHIHLIRNLAKTHCKRYEELVQILITNYFQKIKDLLNGEYFRSFYESVSSINILKRQKKQNLNLNDLSKELKKIADYIISFNRMMSGFEGYSDLSSQQKLSGEAIIKSIRLQVQQIYNQFKTKVEMKKKNDIDQDGIILLFNPVLQNYKNYRFSSTLTHHNLKILDNKKIKMSDIPDNEYTLLSLIEPCLGNKKRTIKLKMEGIKGWVALGIAIRQIAQQNAFKFESGTVHGTFQISYDGYSWTEDSSTNQQYISWHFNEGDTVTLTYNPQTSQITYVRNQQTGNPFVLKIKSDKKDKLYFCVSVNYNQDSVSILD